MNLSKQRPGCLLAPRYIGVDHPSPHSFTGAMPEPAARD